jgi:RecJ-like exonuclease
MKYILIILLAGTVCLWVFGRSQPIVVTTITATQNRAVPCPKCGQPTVEAMMICPKCNGTGKSKWTLTLESKKEKSGAKHTKTGSEFGSLNDTPPSCVNCGGKGKILKRNYCPRCDGGGNVLNTRTRTIRTVRADLSLWEKILAWMYFKPDENSKPQRRFDGSYPLVTKYVAVFMSQSYAVKVIEWSPARLEGKQWIIPIMIEWNDGSGRLVRQGREFVVENREIKESRKID